MNRAQKRVVFGLSAHFLLNVGAAPVHADETVHDEIARLHDRLIGPAAPPRFTWAGAYFGVSLGAGLPLHRGERLQAAIGPNTSYYDLAPPTVERSGMSAGVQAGYNWQLGRLVYGMETDLNFLDGRGGSSGVFPAPAPWAPLMVSSYSLSYSDSARFFGSLRGRIGFADDRTLFYVTAGLATGGTRGPATLIFLPGGVTNPYFARDSDSSRSKYVLGAGIERALGGNVSARFEYLFLNQQLNTQYFVGNSNGLFVARTRNENHVLRFGLNYSLGAENRYTNWERPDAAPTQEELYSVHGLNTNVVQGYPGFRAKYSGQNSLQPAGEVRGGTTSDVFLGTRLWNGAGLYVNPEVNYGYGVADGVGAGSYPNAAYTRGDSGAPYLRFQRYFLRQNIGLGGDRENDQAERGVVSEQLESSENQLSRSVDVNRLIFTIGKYSVGDIFDANLYAHDPTRDFLNYAFNSMGSFDYASDAWGYSYGATAEWKQNWWTFRSGVFQLPSSPGGYNLEGSFCRQCMVVGEAEARFNLFAQPGVFKLLGYNNMGYIARIREINALAISTGALPPDVSDLRLKRAKLGVSLSLAQQVAPNVGFFIRAGLMDGRYETISYADVDRTVAGGFVFSGKLWERPDDEIGLAAAIGGLTKDRQTYFALGGLSIDIGDGAMTYGSEKNIEAFYRWSVADWLEATVDYQLLVNPAYNQDRGPVNLFAVRTRAKF